MKKKQIRKKRVSKFNHALEVIDSHDEKVHDLELGLIHARQERDQAYRALFGCAPGEVAGVKSVALLIKRVTELLQ